MASCPICVKTLGKFANVVRCPECAFSACRGCTKQYLLTVPDGSLKCMAPECSRPWSEDFVAGAISAHWLKHEHKAHLGRLLADTQERFMAGTHKYVGLKRARDEATGEIKNLQEERRRLDMLIVEQQEAVASLDEALKAPATDDGSYKLPCVVCHKGLMCAAHAEAQTMTCASCAASACMSCHAQLREGETHSCDPEARESVSSIKSTSKQCPGCHVYTQKSYGCSQVRGGVRMHVQRWLWIVMWDAHMHHAMIKTIY